MTDDKRFLDRWSRRKTAARTETKDETPVPVEPDTTPTAPAISPSTSPAVDPETLPDIESLDADSDFSAFMQDGVPEVLRNLALRKLWQTDPAFNVVDSLLEYGEDYTNIAAVAETAQSLYKVGKGMVGEDELDAPEGADAAEDREPVERTEAITSETMPKRHHTTRPSKKSEGLSTSTDDDNSNV